MGLGDSELTGPIGSGRFRTSSSKWAWEVQDLQVLLDLGDSRLTGPIGYGKFRTSSLKCAWEVHNFQP